MTRGHPQGWSTETEALPNAAGCQASGLPTSVISLGTISPGQPSRTVVTPPKANKAKWRQHQECSPGSTCSPDHGGPEGQRAGNTTTRQREREHPPVFSAVLVTELTCSPSDPASGGSLRVAFRSAWFSQEATIFISM